MASRFLAITLDLVVLFVALFAISTVISGVGAASGDGGVATAAAVVSLVASFGMLVLWPTLWETATKGRSLGKMVFGLRVVTVDGAPVRFRHSLVRGLVGLVEIILCFGIVAVSVALASSRFRRLGDHLAGTVVTRERAAGAERAFPHRFVPYPGWEAWSARLDAGRLTADDYRLVRSFLLRAGTLPPEAHARIGSQILARVLARTGTAGTTARDLEAGGVEAPLVAVAAAYQRRFDGVTV